MTHPLRHGIPDSGTVAATAFTAPAQATRVTIVHDVPLVPVRAIVAAALRTDSTDRDIAWLDFAADGAAIPAQYTQALKRPLLLVVDLHDAVRSSVDSELLDLLASSPQLSLLAICAGRRALISRGRIEFGAVTAAPSTLVLDPNDIRAAAATAGISLTEADATGLAQTALAQADVLPAVLAMLEPDDEAGDDSETNAIRMRAETSYVLELRAKAMSSDQLRGATSLAVPTSFTTGMLATVAPDGYDHRELDQLTQSRVLLRDGQFRMDPTLRRAVLDEAEARIPDTVADMHSALARHLLAAGKRFEALTHFALAHDWIALIEAIDDALIYLIADDQPTLQRIILDIPRAVRDEHPRLSLYLECEWRGKDSQARPYLAISRKTAASLSRMPDVMRPWDRLHSYLGTSLVQRLKGDYTAALETAAELDLLLAADDMIDRPPLLLAEAHYQGGMSRLLGLDLVGARESFQRSSELARGLDDAVYQSGARATEALALTRALEGEVEQASTLLLSLDDTGSVGTASLVANALVAISRLDPKGARHWLAELADLRDGDEFWAFAVHAGNRYGLYWGDPVETDSDLDRAWAEHGDQLTAGSTAQVLLTSDAADLALLLGQLPRAEAALDQIAVRNTWISVCRARLALLAGNPKHALLFILEGQGRGRTERHGQLDLAVLRAASEHALDRDEDATASLLRAINQSNKSGVIVPFHLLPLETLRSLAALHPDAEAFVNRHELRGTSYLAPYQTLTGALSERELVVLRALDPGATIEQVARKLFVASNTVKAQLRSIYRKLNVSTRTEALLVAAELGLLDEDTRSA